MNDLNNVSVLQGMIALHRSFSEHICSAVTMSCHLIDLVCQIYWCCTAWEKMGFTVFGIDKNTSFRVRYEVSHLLENSFLSIPPTTQHPVVGFFIPVKRSDIELYRA